MSINYKYLYAEANYGDKEIQSVIDVLKNHRHLLMGGKKTKILENKVAKLFHTKYGLMTNSGSSSNLLAIKSFNFPKNSEIITPALTFSTTVSPIVHSGLIPVFIDVHFKTLQINEELVEKAISKKTVAIMAPNLIGNISNWKELKKIASRHNLFLIEDSADTIGYKSKYEYKRPDVSTTSFYASHIITGAGYGGMVCFNNKKNYKQALSLRNWGRRSSNYGENESYIRRFNCNVDGIRYDDKYVFDDLGYNFIGSDISAAFAISKLQDLKSNIKKRISNFNKLKKVCDKFSKYIDTFETTKGYETAWLAFPLILINNFADKRTDLQIYLEKSKIQTRTIFSGNITRQPIAKKFKWRKVGNLKNADIIMKSGLLIGCHELIDNVKISYLEETLNKFFKKKF